MPDIRLSVDGVQYGGWKSARITRGIESIAGSFELSVSDKWAGQEVPWPITEEAECKLVVDGVTVITGTVDRRSLAIDPAAHTFTVSGRDRAGDLVDCSALLSTWEFANVSLLDFARQLTRPFGIPVALQAGLALPAPLAKVTVDPGDSAWEALERACRMAAVLPVSDGQGGIVLTRAGAARAVTALVEGQNILSASGDFDVSGRYRRYVVMGQHPGSEEFSGEGAAAVMGEAQDPSVRRASRVLVVRAESGVTPAYARRRAQWEAKVRAGRADVVNVTVQGWTQGDGTLWPTNAKVPVVSPRAGVDGEMLITQTTATIDDSTGTTTRLLLRRPDAYLPEPVVGEDSSVRWKELTGVTAKSN